MSKSFLWLLGWVVLVIGLGVVDVPTWYAVVGVSGGLLVTLMGIVADSESRKK